MPDVFLSYKREDLKAATRLVAALRAEGIEVWWDRDIRAGAPWEASIEAALAEAKVVLVCWSKAAVASDNVRSEARWAREQGRLIQLFVEPCNPPLFFGERQGIDLSGWSGDASDDRFRDLAAALRERLGQGAPATPAHAAARRVPRRAPIIAAAAIGVALAVLAGWFAWRGLRPSAPADRIAVLPFASLTPGQGAQAFAQGLADQLQGVLNANNMQTISADDAAALRGPDRDRRVAQLGVKLLFDGDIKDDGSNLEVSIRLDDARQHVTLWTSDLSGPSAQPEALEAQAGARIVSVLVCARRALDPKRGLADPATLALYLKACDLFVAAPGGSPDLGDDYRLIDSLREVVAKAPRFTPARAALAKYLAWYAPRVPVERQAAFRAEAEQQAQRVLSSDKTQADAYLALERLTPYRDFAARERLLDQALAADPNSSHADAFKGSLVVETGRLKAAIDFSNRAAAADPFFLGASPLDALVDTGQTAAANTELARILRLYPHLTELWGWGGGALDVYWREADWKDYDALLDNPALQASVISDQDAAFDRLLEKAARSRAPAALASARTAILANQGEPLALKISQLAPLGFVDDAFRLAGDYAGGSLSIYNNTSFLFALDTANLRKDPRFMALAAKLGLVAYWRSSGAWPDFCAEPGLPYDCKAEAAKQ
jgi:TolB-like protein